MLTPKEFEEAVNKNNEKKEVIEIKLTPQEKVDLIMTKIKEDMTTKAKTSTSFDRKVLDFIFPINETRPGFETFLPFMEKDRSTLDDDLSDWGWEIDMLLCESSSVKTRKQIFIRIKPLIDDK